MRATPPSPPGRGRSTSTRATTAGETLEAGAIGAALAAVRAASPGIEVGISTGAWIGPDVGRRLGAIRAWTVRPDLASVNLDEPGARSVCGTLLGRGVGIEAGVWTPEAARLLVA